MRQRHRLLYIANRRLPLSDYRLAYGRLSQCSEVVYGLPGRPSGVKPGCFVEMPFGEGLAFSDANGFLILTRHLRAHRHDYDLVHFFSTKLQLFGPVCAAVACVPSVVTITGFGRTFDRPQWRYRLLRRPYLIATCISLRLARAVFFQNRGDMSWLGQRLPSLAHKLHWAGSGVDANVVREKNFRQRPLVALMAARLMTDKGISSFLEAARRLRGPDYRFVLAGPRSAGEERLYRTVVQEHEQGTIEYRGELSQPELAKLYRESHIFVFPSRYGEGMPRVMLEAGYGLLCPVASDIPAHRDLIRSGAGILLVPGQETESLLAAVRYLQADRAVLEQNARSYQAGIVAQYSMDAYTDRMDRYLSDLRLTAREEVAPPRKRAA